MLTASSVQVNTTACKRLFSLGCVLTPMALCSRARALVAIKASAEVEILRKGQGWVSGSVTAGEDTAADLNVKVQGGQEVVARRAELRPSAQSRASVCKLLQDSSTDVLQQEVDALGSAQDHL